MKQKTSYWLIALLMVCSVVFGGLTGYFCAFYHVKSSQKTFEKEMQKEMTASIDENVKKEASTAAKNALKENMKSIQAEASNQKLSVDTVYRYKNMMPASKQTTTEYETLPKELVGLDRDDDRCILQKIYEQSAGAGIFRWFAKLWRCCICKRPSDRKEDL